MPSRIPFAPFYSSQCLQVVYLTFPDYFWGMYIRSCYTASHCMPFWLCDLKTIKKINNYTCHLGVRSDFGLKIIKSCIHTCSHCFVMQQIFLYVAICVKWWPPMYFLSEVKNKGRIVRGEIGNAKHGSINWFVINVTQWCQQQTI